MLTCWRCLSKSRIKRMVDLSSFRINGYHIFCDTVNFDKVISKSSQNSVLIDRTTDFTKTPFSDFSEMGLWLWDWFQACHWSIMIENSNNKRCSLLERFLTLVNHEMFAPFVWILVQDVFNSSSAEVFLEFYQKFVVCFTD